MKKLCLVALMVLMPATAFAAPEEEAKEEKEKKICRSELATGSRVRKVRTCMTEAEWREHSASTQQGIDKLSRDSALPQQGSNPLGG